MLKWLKRYYVGKGIHGSVRIQSEINSGKPVTGIWLVTLSDCPDNILEIVPAALLAQKRLYDACPLIVGMASSKSDAMDIVNKIVDTVYKKTGGFDAGEYLIRNRG